MKLNPIELIARMDINWRAVTVIATCYFWLTAFNFVFAIPIGYASLRLLYLWIFLSGPAGTLPALQTTPERWAVELIAGYLVATCLLAPFLALSCHRKARVSIPAILATVVLWFVAGVFAVSSVFAFA